MQTVYPFRRYARDLLLWTCGCDIPLQSQGPAAVMQLAGAARALADEIPLDQLMQGVTPDWGDGLGIAPHPGTHLLLRRLGERFNELEIEMILRCLVDYMSFQRLPREDIDTALTRFDILYARARESAAFEVSASLLAFMMLTMLHIPHTRWTMLFMNWGGQLPTTDAQVAALKVNIRQQAHILGQPGATLGPDRGAAYPVFDIYNNTGTDRNANDLDIYYGDSTDTQGTTDPSPTSYGQGYFPTFAGTNPPHPTECSCCGGTDPNTFLGDFDTDTDSDDEPFEGLAATETAESLHEAHLFTKRRWRKFTRRRSRQTRFNMRKSRKGEGRGTSYLCLGCTSYEDAVHTEEVFYGGKGGKGGGKGGNKFRGGKSQGQSFSSNGGQGTGRGNQGRLNPIGPDGNIMLCGVCDSKYHFRKDCPGKDKAAQQQGGHQSTLR